MGFSKMGENYHSLLKQAIDEGWKIGVCAQIKCGDGRVLLIRRSVADTGAGIWEMPGGAVEPEESIENALLREIEEETGLKILLEGLKYKTHFDFHDLEKNKHSRKFCFVCLTEEQPRLSNDHSEFKWFAREEISSMKSSSSDFEIWKDHYNTLLQR